MNFPRLPALLLLVSTVFATHPPALAQPPSARADSAADTSPLADARKGFRTTPIRKQREQEPFPTPPANIFKLVRYDAAPGKLGAYLTPDPKDGKKHPAIVWMTGGDSNTIGDVWSPNPADNDQSASAFRKAGIVMMFPSLRGGNDNPGEHEGFLGEVDDVLAAAAYLAKQPYVDPDRIYLGGHSTGGTLALLTAETSARFRAVFAFGPVGEIDGYGGRFTSFNPANPREAALRSPARWLGSVRSPVFVIEGAGGNIDSLLAMRSATSNPHIRFVAVKGADHFNVLAPANRVIAQKILRDSGAVSNIMLAAPEIAP
ncbi:prolyl oligopeptidase family serine peptidase [Massilia sp. CCM 8733]|uniref:Prolyl oligopeptidase family serine peptidase n=1 Tax=Massilia mucilaginosa TaxID=2609282 RepID=A0ABX0NYB4_9BURK|nr:prolyl oligopeptidase family serine peptidase [Massilia mucilaginosa]NHZ91620.1 prolyl oligopeptidase family serine peptidase [Massilia mucilaginosa]